MVAVVDSSKDIDRLQSFGTFSGKMMVDLNDAVSELESWTSGKAVILHSNGDTFCSGGYTDTVKKILNSEAGFRMSSLMQDSVLRLAKMPLVSVALVQGKVWFLISKSLKQIY
jgi:ethylmalonyl-CoA/methylmalonyl-CoA decarboxylase